MDAVANIGSTGCVGRASGANVFVFFQNNALRFGCGANSQIMMVIMLRNDAADDGADGDGDADADDGDADA